MKYPVASGRAARLLRTTDHRLNDLIRRRKVDAPPVVAGRRLWGPEHLAQAAKALGLDGVPELAEPFTDDQREDAVR